MRLNRGGALALVVLAWITLASGAAEAQTTASQVEDDATLEAFVLGAKAEIEAITTVNEGAKLRERLRTEGDWKSGSMFLIIFLPSGEPFIHGNDRTAESKNLLAVEDDNGLNVVEDLLEAAARGGGFVRYHDGEPKTAYAVAYTSGITGRPFVLVGGYSQDVSHIPVLIPELPKPAVTASQVADRETLITFVEEAARVYREAVLSEGYATLTGIRNAFRSEGGDWKSGSIYLWVVSGSGIILFHATRPDVEGTPTDMTRTDINGVRFAEELIGGARREGRKFLEYYYDDPAVAGDEDTGSPKLGYAVSFSVPNSEQKAVIGSGIYIRTGPPRAAITTDAECDESLCRARTGEQVSFSDASSGSVQSRLWDFSDGQTNSNHSPVQVWSEPGFYQVALLVSDGSVRSTASLTFLVEAAEPAGTCVADDQTRCLQDSRFAVEMDWWTGDGRSGPGRVVHHGTNDSGLFYFFFESGDNWEVLIKVLDGCSVNEHVWVYGASATTLGYRIRVTDTVTGTFREYLNTNGRRADAITDSGAFAGICEGRSTAASPAPEPVDPTPSPWLVGASASSEEGGCAESATTLCLLDRRYEVSVAWSKAAAAGDESSETGPGSVLSPRTADSGLFHFFGPNNWEMLVKVLDACDGYGHHWVFAAAATDLGLDLVVRDTVTGAIRQYVKDPGEPSPAVADVTAFPDACRSD
ncbi:MAG: cache domain-containing protein [Acidobacteriota bacterium]|nr:cache domain-containing protein [Acidobacteriota bacterium]